MLALFDLKYWVHMKGEGTRLHFPSDLYQLQFLPVLLENQLIVIHKLQLMAASKHQVFPKFLVTSRPVFLPQRQHVTVLARLVSRLEVKAFNITPAIPHRTQILIQTFYCRINPLFIFPHQ